MVLWGLFFLLFLLFCICSRESMLPFRPWLQYWYDHSLLDPVRHQVATTTFRSSTHPAISAVFHTGASNNAKGLLEENSTGTGGFHPVSFCFINFDP